MASGSTDARHSSGPHVPEEDLAVAIAETRGGAGAGRVARALLAADDDGWLLVGLVEGGQRAVLYHPADWRVVRAPFGGGGVDGLADETVDRANGVRQLEAWVRERGTEHWDWLHPRFRWVLRGAGEDG